MLKEHVKSKTMGN